MKYRKLKMKLSWPKSFRVKIKIKLKGKLGFTVLVYDQAGLHPRRCNCTTRSRSSTSVCLFELNFAQKVLSIYSTDGSEKTSFLIIWLRIRVYVKAISYTKESSSPLEFWNDESQIGCFPNQRKKLVFRQIH